jgi:hypothetical protein
MRASLFLAAAAGAVSFGFSQPASAGWDGCCEGGSVYVHHHVYYPPRYRHVYYVHRPAPLHVNVVDGCCAGPGWYPYGYRYSGYFAMPYYYRWQWRGRRGWW